MIRLANTEDLSALRRVVEGTDMFLGEELDSFVNEMERHLTPIASGEKRSATLIVATDGEGDNAPVMGAAYLIPEVMAQGVMNLAFIGVLPDTRRKGFGAALLARFEEAARQASARLAIIETASDEMFAPAWSLYRSNGYGEEARVRDFYDDGLDKIVFRKRLND